MSNIVVFGATGYTGDLVVRALLERGVRPVLAARNEVRLKALAAEFGDLEYRVADVDRPDSVVDLVERGDVLVTTVGPFLRYGRPALRAAVEKGAHYLDSTGEPAFIREVFETWGPQARAAGVGLLTAMGYDYVPGNLAAALALRDAGEAAVAVDIGYFALGPLTPAGISGGTRASLAGAMFEHGHARRAGSLRTERAGLRYRTFDVGGKRRGGVSLGGSEHLTVPLSAPQVRDVDVFLGWFGPAGRPLSLASRTAGIVLTLPPVQRLAERVVPRILTGSTGGPDAPTRAKFRTAVVAEVRDAGGATIARATVQGVNPYDFTGRMLAWGARRALDGGLTGPGALGPADGFGLDALVEGCREAGVERTG